MPWSVTILIPVYDQECAEDVDDPVEFLNQRNAGDDEHSAHDKGSENSPEENLVLHICRNPEVREDEKKDEQIVDAQSLFNQIASQKLKRWPTPAREIDEDVEREARVRSKRRSR